VEALSTCPTGWKIPTTEGNRWIAEMMEPVFPLGVYKDETAEREKVSPSQRTYTSKEIVRALEIPTDEETFESKLGERALRNPEIKVAGFGGQGILLLGVALAQAGMKAGYETTWLPSYGPEMRGGTANCHVRISESRIGTPLVQEPDVLLAFNGPSMDKFAPLVKPGGLILYDSSLVDREVKREDIVAYGLPFTEVADKEIGNSRTANFVAMGAFTVASRGLLNEAVVKSILPLVIKRAKMIDINEQAIDVGIRLAKEAIPDAG
jgi:Pyruvate/2-oxoacid:ferredoxin oxidoreductase gamma subunit